MAAEPVGPTAPLVSILLRPEGLRSPQGNTRSGSIRRPSADIARAGLHRIGAVSLTAAAPSAVVSVQFDHKLGAQDPGAGHEQSAVHGGPKHSKEPNWSKRYPGGQGCAGG